MAVMRMMHQDPDEVKGAKLDRGLVRRVGRFARPYRAQLIGFVIMIAAGAALALVPPLLFRNIIDDAIPAKDRTQLSVLAAIVVAAALVDAVAAAPASGTGPPGSARASSTTCAWRCSTTCSACRSRSSPGPRPAR